MEVEWDDEKAASNWDKHQVTFEEAVSALDDPLAITYDDPVHSAEEERFISIGLSRLNRLLLVSHTDRAGKIRIISARLVTRGERKHYEDEN
jgi:uncharacterized DUF497 family protein